MLKFDRILFNFLFGSVIPILCFLLFWWGSLLFTKENKEISITAFTGLGLGLVISIFLKLRLKPDIFGLSKLILVLIYLFYNAGMFGFFMGVPLFHPVLGVIAGYYWVKRLFHHTENVTFKDEIKRISMFTTVITGIVCMFSATIALISKSTPSDLKQMVHLGFDINQSMLISLIAVGGLLLLCTQFFLTKITMEKILNLNKIKLK